MITYIKVGDHSIVANSTDRHIVIYNDLDGSELVSSKFSEIKFLLKSMKADIGKNFPKGSVWRTVELLVK